MKGLRTLTPFRSGVAGLAMTLLSAGAACRQSAKPNSSMENGASAGVASRPGGRSRARTRSSACTSTFTRTPRTPSSGADVTEENIATLPDRVKPDYIQYDCKGHAG